MYAAPRMTPSAEAAARATTRGTFGPGPFDDFDDFSLYDRCITRGVLGSLLPVIYGNGVRITQNPEAVAISYEMIHDTRIIPLDGRPALDSGIRQWMGSARGRFEGDTLVIETTFGGPVTPAFANMAAAMPLCAAHPECRNFVSVPSTQHSSVPAAKLPHVPAAYTSACALRPSSFPAP